MAIFLVFLQFVDECCVVDTFALRQRARKALSGRCNTLSLPPERSFSGLMTLFDIDLLCMRRDDEKNPTGEAGPALEQIIWFPCLTDRNPAAFSSAQLRYLNLISVYKSIWGSVFILVCWECWGKREGIIHNSLNLTDDRNQMIEKTRQRVLLCAFHVNLKRNPSMLKRLVEK